MAKGGGKRRSYVRDGNGRFASTPGGGGGSKGGKKGPAVAGGTLAKRSALKKAKAKLAAKDSADDSIKGTKSRSAQKGVVTRSKNALRAAKKESRTRMKVGKGSTVAKPKGLKPGALAERRARKTAVAQPKVKRNRFLDPIARRILIATGQLPAKKK